MIPVSKPCIRAKELEYVSDAVRSGWVSSLGSYIDLFESEFARYCGTRHAVSVANGTVGLHLALLASGVKPGDEVIVPDLTFVATANAVKYCNATPIIVDIDRNTYCIEPNLISNAITDKTKAIIPVHLYGQVASVPKIKKIVEGTEIKIIEDAAEAHGASLNSSKVGSLGDLGVFSFYGNKIITTGEGGMITTDDTSMYEHIKYLRDHAMSKSIRYWHTEIGYNYRMTNMQAALGVAQLESIEEFLKERDVILEIYRSILEPRGIECNPRTESKSVNWITCALLKSITREQRDATIKKLGDLGVEARPFFFPLSSLPIYFNNNETPISSSVSQSGFNLPTFIGMTESEIRFVCDSFLKSIPGNEK